MIFKKDFFSFRESMMDWRKACLSEWNASEMRENPYRIAYFTTNRKKT